MKLTAHCHLVLRLRVSAALLTLSDMALWCKLSIVPSPYVIFLDTASWLSGNTSDWYWWGLHLYLTQQTSYSNHSRGFSFVSSGKCHKSTLN